MEPSIDLPQSHTVVADGNTVNTLLAGGVIGTMANPLDVRIAPGSLRVGAGGARNGVSISIQGTTSTLDWTESPLRRTLHSDAGTAPKPADR